MTRSRGNIFSGIDLLAVALYIALSLIGFVSIFSATWDEQSADVFSLSHEYIKQAMWIGVGWLLGFILLLSESRYYHMLAYYAYGAGIVALLAVLLFGREVNGAKAWFEIGSVRIQPVEFVKIAIALAVARMMSAATFSISRAGDLFRLAAIILLPLGIIVAQNDTGSGIVLGSLIFVLYREGLNKWLCIPVIFVALLFVVSFVVQPDVLLASLVIIFTLSEAMLNNMWRSRIRFLAAIFLGSFVIQGVQAMLGGNMQYYQSLLISSAAGVVVAAVYAFRNNMRNIFIIIALYLSSMIFLPMSDIFFNSVLKPHQQVRILNFLGLKEDLRDTGYNVHQSKIAIGSGGFAGKGYLKGTQIKYGFVPEKHTDFIFCTIGEEWGFLGSIVVLALLMLLILRIMRMGDRQREAFGRIYCYCVAAILLMHILINIGMTIGLIPVMGIPLPLISYGGSSFVAFTLMIFIAINIDASTQRHNAAFGGALY